MTHPRQHLYRVAWQSNAGEHEWRDLSREEVEPFMRTMFESGNLKWIALFDSTDRAVKKFGAWKGRYYALDGSSRKERKS